MVRTIIYIRVNAYYRESSQNTGLHSFLDTFTDSRNVFLRNRTTDYCGFELEQFFSIGVHRLKFNFTVTVLSTSTRLFCIFAIHFHSLCKGLLVCYLRCTYVCFYLKFTKQTVNNNFQMQLTHTSNDRLTSLMIGVCTEGRVLLSQFCKRFAQFTLSSFCLRFDCQLDNRFRELHGFQDNRMLIITDRITGSSEFKSDRSSDISGIYLIQFHTFVGMHLQNTSHTLFLVLRSIQHIRTGVHHTGIYSEVSQLTNEWVSHNLKCQCGERLIVRGMSHDCISIHIYTLDSRDVSRSWHELYDSVQKLLNTFVSVRSTTAYRNC